MNDQYIPAWIPLYKSYTAYKQTKAIKIPNRTNTGEPQAPSTVLNLGFAGSEYT